MLAECIISNVAREKLPAASQVSRLEEEEEVRGGGAGRPELAECINAFIEHSVKCMKAEGAAQHHSK